MNKNVLNKKIVIFIVFLFIIICLNSSTGLSVEKKSFDMSYYNKILYVGGSGESNYSTIQDAINDTMDGDMVFVYDDSSPYFENLIIKKSIFLMGEDINTTIIDGLRKKEVIYISTNNIEISGFTIINSSDNKAGIYVYKNANYVKIISNIIKENYIGIYMYNPGWHMLNIQANYLGPDNNCILKNFIINNICGICLIGSNNNLIRQNWIENNNYGIKITRYDYPTAPTSNGNRINKNIFIGNNVNAFDKCNNKWESNFWDDWIGLRYKILKFMPYRISGTLLKNFDWHPALNPNDVKITYTLTIKEV